MSNSNTESRDRKPTRAFSIAAAVLISVVLTAGIFSAACSRTKSAPARASEAWNAGDYELAAEEYERFLERHPTGAEASEARFQLANVYFLNLRRYEQARLHYEEFLAGAPDHPEAGTARERLAEVLFELGRGYEAIAEYENLNPEDPHERRRIRLQIADLYFDQKNYSQALTEYARVTEGAPYDELTEQAHLREATIYHLARGQYGLAIPVYRVLAESSAHAQVRRRALYAIADCHTGLHEFEKAIEVLRRISDEEEQEYISERIAELETLRKEAAQARSGLGSRPPGNDRQ